ncbi:hypothetical protein ALC57_06805 [Trachymyrmex cornetzi]|uniref:Uncharacterized protein n=1 Tax=Trachymyrmex cornetzi TaxID=471704 RepID=A0A195E6T9_9HYME|nr:hypothetical protein ALC57_06805 [Trachymyrmex cornetzi]
MADFSRTSAAVANTNINRTASEINTSKRNYWRQMLKSYEKRNASLERKRNVLVERVCFMECTLPSLMMGIASSTAYGKGVPEQAKIPENTSKSSNQRI